MTGARSPYVGLRPFEVDETDYFHGRFSATWELTSWLLSSRLVIVYGPSGVGKTSLIQAGVLAGLGPDQAQVLPVGRTVGVPSTAMGSELGYNPFAAEVLSCWAPHESNRSIRGQTVAQFLMGLPVRCDQYDDPLPLVAVIDQFEEIFVDNPGWTGARHDFLEQLVEAVQTVGRLQLLLSMRSDVLSEILPYEQRLSRGSRKRFPVAPLDFAGALEAATGPLRATHRSFAPGTAEVLVDTLRTTTVVNALGDQRTITADTIEPVHLQVVCAGLWNALPDDVTTITHEHLDFGDVEDTLARFCAEVVADIAALEGVPEADLWEWLERTFITELGTRGSAYEGIASTGGMPNTVARACEEKRLLRAEKRSGSVWFELLHDGLIEPIRSGRRSVSGSGAASVPHPTADTYLRMAEVSLADGSLSRAEEYAGQAMLGGSSDPILLADAASLLARVLHWQGRDETGARADELYDSAEGHFRRAAQLLEAEQDTRAVARVLASLGQLFRERGRFADAVHAYNGAIARLPDDIDIRLGFAQALSDAGQPVAAQGQYATILAISPGMVDALVGRGIVASAHGDPAAAIADLESAVRQQPGLEDDPDVRAALASARSRVG